MENAQAREIGSYFLERTHHYAPRMTLHYIYIYIYIYMCICIYVLHHMYIYHVEM